MAGEMVLRNRRKYWGKFGKLRQGGGSKNLVIFSGHRIPNKQKRINEKES